MRKYHQLNRMERYQLEKLLQEGKTPSQAAVSLGFNRSSIYRELSRNRKKDGTYSALEAWRRTLDRRRRQDFGPKQKIKGWVEEKILDLLGAGCSPEQISGRLRLEKKISLSHEAIYKFILKDKEYGGTLYKCLRRRGRHRRMKKTSRFLPTWVERRLIEERPKEANDRSEIGHWERDTLVGKDHEGGLLVFTDRKSRYSIIDPLQNLGAEESIQKTLGNFKNKFPCISLTNDNGSEFGKPQLLETALGVPVFFARPYAPWQRGTVENTIGLIRQFVPKGTPTKSIPLERIKQIEEAINLRPKKTLGYRTPKEIFFGIELELCSETQHGRYERAAEELCTQEAACL